MTGVVLASPSTGDVKAVMPVFNAYADIKVENFVILGANSSGRHVAEKEERILPIDDSVSATGANVYVDTSINSDGEKSWRLKLKDLMGLDARHLAIMVGLSSLLGAITNIVYSLGFGSDAPQSLLLAVGIAGFVGGRFVSERLRSTENG